MAAVVAVLVAPLVWIGAGLALMVVAFAVTAVVSLAYRVLASDPNPANDPATALGTALPILIGALTAAPFLLIGGVLAVAVRLAGDAVARLRSRARARRRAR